VYGKTSTPCSSAWFTSDFLNCFSFRFIAFSLFLNSSNCLAIFSFRLSIKNSIIYEVIIDPAPLWYENSYIYVKENPKYSGLIALGAVAALLVFVVIILFFIDIMIPYSLSFIYHMVHGQRRALQFQFT
jgi:hypothetical protein